MTETNMTSDLVMQITPATTPTQNTIEPKQNETFGHVMKEMHHSEMNSTGNQTGSNSQAATTSTEGEAHTDLTDEHSGNSQQHAKDTEHGDPQQHADSDSPKSAETSDEKRLSESEIDVINANPNAALIETNDSTISSKLALQPNTHPLHNSTRSPQPIESKQNSDKNPVAATNDNVVKMALSTMAGNAATPEAVTTKETSVETVVDKSVVPPPSAYTVLKSATNQEKPLVMNSKNSSFTKEFASAIDFSQLHDSKPLTDYFKLTETQLPANTQRFIDAMLAENNSIRTGLNSIPSSSGNETSNSFSGIGIATSGLENAGHTTNLTTRIAIPMPLQHSQWSNTFAERIHWAVNQNLQSATIHINPKDIGPISSKITIENNKAEISFVAQHGVVRDALEQSIPRLRELLQSSGIELSDATVSDQASYSQKDNQSESEHGNYSIKTDESQDNQIDMVTALPYQSSDRIVDYYA